MTNKDREELRLGVAAACFTAGDKLTPELREQIVADTAFDLGQASMLSARQRIIEQAVVKATQTGRPRILGEGPFADRLRAIVAFWCDP